MAKYIMKSKTTMKWSKKFKSSSLLSVHCVVLFNFFWRCWTDLFFSCTFVLVHLLFPIQTLKFLNVEFRYLLISSSRDQDWLGECESRWMWSLQLVLYLRLPLFYENVRICVKERSFNCTTYILGGSLCFSWFLIDTKFLISKAIILSRWRLIPLRALGNTTLIGL